MNLITNKLELDSLVNGRPMKDAIADLLAKMEKQEIALDWARETANVLRIRYKMSRLILDAYKAKERNQHIFDE